MKVYYYTSHLHWKSIKDGSPVSEPRLKVSEPLGEFYPPARETKAISALLEPVPTTWLRLSFPRVWERLKRKELGNATLLEIETDGLSQVFVVEQAHIEGNRTKNPSREFTEMVERQYIESLVPINDYLTRQEELGYLLPEVIITQHVPFSHIRVSPFQPLLEEYIEWEKRFHTLRWKEGELALGFVQQVPELKLWYEAYQSRQEAEGGAVAGERRLN